MAVINGTVVGASAGFYPKEIEQSLRFNDDDSAYLSRTPASEGNRGTWTWSGWVRRGNLGSIVGLFGAGNASNNWTGIYYNNDSLYVKTEDAGTVRAEVYTTAVFRDVGAWYHVVVGVDTTEASASDRIKIYVNGEIQTLTTLTSPSATSGHYKVNATIAHSVGAVKRSSYDFVFDGYLAETHFIDGTAYTASDFGEFKNGVWVAKQPDVTYGTNGFYLDFADGGAIGNDVSGNNNNWTPTNLASTDVMLDSPTNNFATLNPLSANDGSSTYTEGNLVYSGASTSSFYQSTGTMGMSSGKWYWELIPELGSSMNTTFGIAKDTASYDTGGIYNNTGFWLGNFDDGTNFYYYANGSTDGYDTVNIPNGSVIGIAFDADTPSFSFYVNGVFQTSFASVTSGTFVPVIETQGTGAPSFKCNFGQDSSFAGNKVPQGYTDANGRGDFYYAPPAGYLALCTANLPEPAIGPNSSSQSDEHFNTVLYTGNGSTSHAITGVGFQPDFTWLKPRSAAYNHRFYDVIRGATKTLSSNTTAAEATNANSLLSLDSDGFTVGSDPSENESSTTYVAWNWKANGSGVSNTDGSITSTVSANVDAGFSIIAYNGTGSAGTIGHGLTKAPALIIAKSRSVAAAWPVWHQAFGTASNSDYLRLNDTISKGYYGAANYWNSTVPTSSVLSIGTDGDINTNGSTNIIYAFAEIEGFSKFGSYTGNGSADGPFIFTNFRPAFVMVKRTDAVGSWVMFDNVRGVAYNVTDDYLRANLSDAEGVDAVNYKVDLLSNGFKLRATGSQYNVSGGTYIYACFAENPFKYSNAR